MTDRDTPVDLGNMGAQIAHDPGGAARLIVSLRAERERLREAIAQHRALVLHGATHDDDCTDADEALWELAGRPIDEETP